jgi:hypothetical protein
VCGNNKMSFLFGSGPTFDDKQALLRNSFRFAVLYFQKDTEGDLRI